ncbi:MAG: enoyl-CoA hydratase [Deltaproteobacteria bacterium]|nr:enoyl-CoA hydratase [Deltaproteobacteria bacterium]
MSAEPVLFEKDGHVGYLVLNRGEQRNALSLEMMKEIMNRLNMLAEDKDVKVVVIRANGPAFCAGHDLVEMVGPDKDIHHYRNIFSTCSQMMQRIHEIPQPVIAQVKGIATAAGCQLVAGCDLAIAEKGAKFQTPGVLIGLFCITPMVPLVRAVGRKRALEMLLTGRFISAEEAERFGLINFSVPLDQLENETRKLAQNIAQYSRHTLASGKQAFYGQVDLDEASAYDYAKELIALNCLAEDAREGISAFIEKRKPEWKDR